MKKFAFIIDVGKCENCNNCFLSCKDEHCGNDWPGYSRPQPLHGHRWINIRQNERGTFPLVDVAYLPTPCMHCGEPACKKVGGDAVVQREDGIVLFDPVKAKGRRDLVPACPYGAVWWNEEEQLPQKCTLCAHLLDEGWSRPRCVQSCPTGALSVFKGEDSALRAQVEAEKLQLLPGRAATQPRCYYRNLHRYTSCFLAGSVATTVAGVEECAVGAQVVLKQAGRVVRDQQSDEFGDFKFDDLESGGTDYTVEITFEGQTACHGPFKLDTSCSVGTVRFNEDLISAVESACVGEADEFTRG